MLSIKEKRIYLLFGLMALCAVIVWSCDKGSPPPRLRGARINDEWYCYL